MRGVRQGVHEATDVVPLDVEDAMSVGQARGLGDDLAAGEGNVEEAVGAGVGSELLAVGVVHDAVADVVATLLGVGTGFERPAQGSKQRVEIRLEDLEDETSVVDGRRCVLRGPRGPDCWKLVPVRWCGS